MDSSPKAARSTRDRSVINVNITWGIVLLIFGLVMYYFAKRGKNV